MDNTDNVFLCVFQGVSMCIQKYNILVFVPSHSSVAEIKLKDIESFIAQTVYKKISDADHKALQKFLSNLRTRWTTARRIKAKFIEQNQSWLDGNFCLSEPVCSQSSATCNKGRRSLPFEEMSHRSKLRVTEELRQETPQALAFATASNLRNDGYRTSAHLVEAIASPGRWPAMARKMTSPELAKLFLTHLRRLLGWSLTWTSAISNKSLNKKTFLYLKKPNVADGYIL